MILQIPNVVGEDPLRAIEASPRFVSAALPARYASPIIRRLGVGAAEGPHVQPAVRNISGSAEMLRVDVVAILMMSRSEDSSGGDLLLRDSYGEHRFALGPGTLLLYPACLQQRFSPMSQGHCVFAEVAVQSIIQDSAQRKVLFDLEMAIAALPGSAHTAKLQSVYDRLLNNFRGV